MEAVIRSHLHTLVIAVALVSGASSVSAHKLGAQRSIFFEPVGANELHVLVRLELPAGKPSDALVLGFDLDRNGQLDSTEEDRLRRHLTERALAHLELQIDDRRSSLSEAKSEMRRPPRGGFELMIYGKLALSAGAVSVQLDSDPAAEPATVTLLGGGRPIRSGFGLRQSDGGFRSTLGPAGRLRFELAPGR